MRNASNKSRNRLILTLAFAIALVFPAIPAGAAAEEFTLHFSNVETVQITNPCFGPATGTLTYDAVIHVTTNSNVYHAVINIHGDSSTVPDDPNEPAFSGHFSEHQVLNSNRRNAVNTFVVTQQADGMKFHITFHLALNASGGELSVFNWACGN